MDVYTIAFVCLTTRPYSACIWTPNMADSLQCHSLHVLLRISNIKKQNFARQFFLYFPTFSSFCKSETNVFDFSKSNIMWSMRKVGGWLDTCICSSKCVQFLELCQQLHFSVKSLSICVLHWPFRHFFGTLLTFVFFCCCLI